jgi:hypothetical protein
VGVISLLMLFLLSMDARGGGGAPGSCHPVGNKLDVSGVLDAVNGVIAVTEGNHVRLIRQCSAPSSIKLRL